MAEEYARLNGKIVYISISEWGVVDQMIADETGDTPEKVHEELKNKFLSLDHFRKSLAGAGLFSCFWFRMVA